MNRLDIISDDDNELLIQNGDFVIFDNTLGQAKQIILVSAGEYRQHPTLGVGINNYIGSSVNKVTLYNIIKTQLNEDSIVLDDINITKNGNQFDFDLTIK